MKNTIKQYISPVLVFAVVLIMATSCAKDKYYLDGGVANPVYNGTVLQYLQSNPKFDTIAQIVKLAGLEDVFSKEEITFFAPTDEVIRRDIGQVNSTIPALRNKLNQLLFNANKDTIKTLADVSPELWRRYLLKYVVKGKSLLKDYPQLDFDLRQLYPGGYYYMYNSDLANIGVVYNDANGVRYAGYRQLSISRIFDPSNPNRYFSAAVATSDIQPSNGVVHVLAVYIGNGIGGVRLDELGSNKFGMSDEFDRDVILSK
ncbi:fasciclin domain-containing protein [Mucilaginibacter myungsuensis]|uniref:Fasciclin domain-containing protein n=1 Tax=Mucilaginibacter myungsuensis TaxID=649104 RepID=A0A929L624_9SPHI|nr:fasciclin domain-containing protein [Mucilaginibacter myungsuensis]MBE9664635.1 fasciclin domain-containing protein [Mucilaginibacter myungsuensis]MDN3601474.1 fasciclin domain-containing protein [Mucilaginibacter myungsuensis]